MDVLLRRKERSSKCLDGRRPVHGVLLEGFEDRGIHQGGKPLAMGAGWRRLGDRVLKHHRLSSGRVERRAPGEELVGGTGKGVDVRTGVRGRAGGVRKRNLRRHVRWRPCNLAATSFGLLKHSEP